MAAEFVELDVEGRTVKVTNPSKVFYSARGETKLDHVRYYLSVGEGIVRARRSGYGSGTEGWLEREIKNTLKDR